MGRLITFEQYMNMVAEKTLDNTQQLKKSVHQRRNGMEDLYGVCFSAHATDPDHDGRYSARFYVSLSPDYVYLHRFAFKFVIMPSIIEDEDPSEGRDWRVYLGQREDKSYVPITAYLKEQQGLDPTDPLFNGEGIYPNNKLESLEDFYDILDVVSVMIAEGDEDDAEIIISPMFKPVIISSLKPFSVDAYLYLKYSNTNR